MKKILQLSLSLSIFLMITVSLSAETFYLKDGNKVTGEIVSHEDAVYTVTTSFGIVDIPESNIDKISDKETVEPEESETKEITIVTNEIKRDYTPDYEDDRYHDPLYIAYSQARLSATALTATGASFFTIGSLSMLISLPIYFALQSSGYVGLLADCMMGSNGSEIVTNSVLAVLLPCVITPTAIGFILLMACIAPWIYTTKLLHKWQAKYHVQFSMTSEDELQIGFCIKI